MKTPKITIAAVAAIVAVVAFAACADPEWDKNVRPDIGLTKLTVQPVSFNANNEPIPNPNAPSLEVQNIPEPVIEGEWDDAYFNIAEGDSEELWFLLEDHTETARIIVESTPGTVVSWGIGNAATRPESFTGPGAPLPFGNDDVIYVRVSTRDAKYRSYYRIHARLASPTSMLSLISVAGRETKIRPAEDGRRSWEGDEIDPQGARESAVPTLVISIAKKEGVGADTLATKLNDNAKIRYAKIPDGAAIDTIALSSLNFTHSEDKNIYIPDAETGEPILYLGSEIPFTDQDILVAEVTAQNLTDKYYYKFRVSVGHIVNINKLEMVAGPEVSQVLGLGVPNPNWDSVVSGRFATAAVDPTFAVNITLEDDDGDYEFVKIATADPAPPFGSKPASLTFGTGEELAIKVDSATKIGGQPAATQYYKVRVNLQSAIILEQPKNNVYYIESYTYQPISAPDEAYDGRILINATGDRTLRKPIEPLKAVLDRTGNFSYQWYTANSWYGGYGFDKDGRLIGDPDPIEDAYHPAVAHLDEKNNVSFHNGGNEFYRLPYAGFQIDGATSEEFYPIVDASRRPFLPGFSSQTQYYWVVIKDQSGREVTSERAVIVTEWGEVFDMGHPTGTKVNKKHHIVNLRAYSEGGFGLQGTPINLEPFSYHREKRIIPITFPADFDVYDYKIVTVQANFYLADGTPWIQNWTQGDFGFEKDGQGQVLWYNLTNDNGTYGLDGTSKEPQGATLAETPTHVVVKPAGETPPNDRPFFLPDGVTPDREAIEAAGLSAQGWFTHYIELTEIHFEGPARER